MISRRHLILAVLLLGTLAAVAAVSDTQQDHPLVAFVDRTTSSIEPEVRELPLPHVTDRQYELLELHPKGRDEEEPVGLFHVAAPPPVSALALPIEEKPVAPPLPIKFLGRMEQDDGSVLLLSVNGQEATARVGDSIGGQYKLESIAESMLRFRYLPLNELQTLQIGDGK